MIKQGVIFRAIIYRAVGIIVTTVFGLLVGLFCTEIRSIAIAATIVSAYLIIVMFYIGVEQYRRFSSFDAVEQSKYMEDTREAILLFNASDQIAGNFKEINYELPKILTKAHSLTDS
ncbi:hypothetical protein ACFL55_03015, partial [Candidatus Latescibacterota bacterium]